MVQIFHFSSNRAMLIITEPSKTAPLCFEIFSKIEKIFELIYRNFCWRGTHVDTFRLQYVFFQEITLVWIIQRGYTYSREKRFTDVSICGKKNKIWFPPLDLGRLNRKKIILFLPTLSHIKITPGLFQQPVTVARGAFWPP